MRLDFTNDPAGSYAALILVAFVLIETSFRLQSLTRDFVKWLLVDRPDKKAMTKRMTAEEKMLSEYMIG